MSHSYLILPVYAYTIILHHLIMLSHFIWSYIISSHFINWSYLILPHQCNIIFSHRPPFYLIILSHFVSYNLISSYLILSLYYLFTSSSRLTLSYLISSLLCDILSFLLIPFRMISSSHLIIFHFILSFIISFYLVVFYRSLEDISRHRACFPFRQKPCSRSSVRVPEIKSVPEIRLKSFKGSFFSEWNTIREEHSGADMKSQKHDVNDDKSFGAHVAV